MCIHCHNAPKLVTGCGLSGNWNLFFTSPLHSAWSLVSTNTRAIRFVGFKFWPFTWMRVNWHFWTGDEARRHGRGPVVGLELENGRGHNGKWSILRAIWSRAKRPVRKGLQCRAQVRCAREPAYNQRRRLRSGQVIIPLVTFLFLCINFLELFNALEELTPNSFSPKKTRKILW